MIKRLDFRELTSVLKNHIVEMLLFVATYIVIIFDIPGLYESNNLTLTLIAIALTYSMNNLFKEGRWRFLYYTSWIFVVMFQLVIDNYNWSTEPQAIVALFLLSPLAVVLSRRNVTNEAFVSGVMTLVRSLATAVLFASVISLLCYFISMSIMTIFSIYSDLFLDSIVYIYGFIWCVIAPLTLFNYANNSAVLHHRGSTLINYIFTPAIIVYAIILYVYVIDAIVTWELPNGGIAYLVFGFTIFTLIVKSLRELINERILSGFFDNFSFISIPILILFWIGVNERISQYGFTQWRVYLVVCGVVMTLCVVMFMTKRYASYYRLALLAFVVFAAIAVVPGISAKDISFRSQRRIAVSCLEKLELLDSNNRIIKVRKAVADSLQIEEYKRLKSAVDYVMDIDDSAFKVYGVDYKLEVFRLIPGYSDYDNDCDEDEDDEWSSLDLYFNNKSQRIDISGYDYIYCVEPKSYDKSELNYYDDSDRVLSVYIEGELLAAIGFDELIENRVGEYIRDRDINDPVRDIKSDLNSYKTDSMMIIFKSITIAAQIDSSSVVLKNVSVDKVLTKKDR